MLFRSRDVDAVARGLIALGLEHGDRLGVWAPNCAEWTLLQYATAKIGVVLVTVNPAYRTHELAYVVRQSGLRALMATSRFKTSDYAAMIESVRPDLPGLEHVVLIDTDDYLCGYPLIEFSGGAGTTVRWEWAESLFDRLAPEIDNTPGPKGDRSAVAGKTFMGFGDQWRLGGSGRR